MNFQFFYSYPSYLVLTGGMIYDTNMIMPFLSDKWLLHQVYKDLGNAQAIVPLHIAKQWQKWTKAPLYNQLSKSTKFP